jgi:hypothetical protein
MQFWDEMNSKYGFGDGTAIPNEAEMCRAVYVQALNALAEHKKSKVRAVCYNRGGCHNSVLICMVTLKHFKTLTEAQVMGEDDIPEWEDAAEPTDAAWEATVEECQTQGLDDYIVSVPKLDKAFERVVSNLKAGKLNLTSNDTDAAEEALGREVDADELRNALDE